MEGYDDSYAVVHPPRIDRSQRPHAADPEPEVKARLGRLLLGIVILETLFEICFTLGIDAT